MGPKKKERDTDHSSSSKGGNTNGRSDSVQADHELFLQAFESKHIKIILTEPCSKKVFSKSNLGLNLDYCVKIWELA